MRKFVMDMAIAAKVLLAPAVALLLMCGLGLAAHQGMSRLFETVDSFHRTRLPLYEATSQIAAGVEELNADFWKTVVMTAAKFPEERRVAIDRRIASLFDEVTKVIESSASRGDLSQQEVKAFNVLKERFQAYRAAAQRAMKDNDGDLAYTAMIVAGTEKTYELLRSATRDLQVMQAKSAGQGRASSEEVVKVGNMLLLGVLVFGILVASGLAFASARMISKPLKEAVKVGTALASGDLTVEVAAGHRDESGQVLDAMSGVVSNLSKMVGDIHRAAAAVELATSEIAAGNLDLSGRTERHAAALRSTVSSIEQINSTVARSADTAREADRLARRAADVATESGAVVRQVVGTMDVITESARKIAEIIGVIDGIAFQTNILALNAAVEAARAGDAGRGFAVVASEVRGLARRSADAAKDIRGLITDSVNMVEQGAREASAAGKQVDEVVESIRHVSTMVGEISSATTDQAQGINLVSVSVQEMDESTQQNAALVEQASAATESLRSQAQRLVELISVFRVPGARD